jgi:hypothetical protein
MTREEIFKKNFPQYVTEKGVCLSPFWDLFDAGIEVATYELNKGIIQVLTKENAELKADFIKSCKVKEQGFREAEQALERKDKQLIKAKVIIKELVKGVRITFDHKGFITDVDAFVSKAEQFLKDSEVKK